MSIYVAILAGGSGRRFGGDRPKQFMTLGGRTVLEHSLERFSGEAAVDGIVAVCSESMISEVKRLTAPYKKVVAVVPGGAERRDSSRNALNALSFARNDDCLLIHDAARPLVSSALINRVITALAAHEAVTVAIPLCGTVYKVAPGRVEAILDRSSLHEAQTPQGFRVGLLRAAQAASCDAGTTDDAGTALAFGAEVCVVSGDPDNLKITTSKDLAVAEALLNCRFRNF